MDNKLFKTIVIIVICALTICAWNLRHMNWWNTNDPIHIAKIGNQNFRDHNDSQLQHVGDDDDTNSGHSEYVNKEPNNHESSVFSESHIHASQGNAIKTILLWNNFYNAAGYGIGLGNETLALHGCPVHQCSFTSWICGRCGDPWLPHTPATEAGQEPDICAQVFLKCDEGKYST